MAATIKTWPRRFATHSKRSFKRAAGFWKPYQCALQQRNNGGIYAVRIHANVGFFAHINWCLWICAHCERYNLRPYIVLSSQNYSSSGGDNWLEYYFDNLSLTLKDREAIENGRVTVSRVANYAQLGLAKGAPVQMDLAKAADLLNKYLKVRDSVKEYVDSFVARRFANKNVLGVHYRGTDKKSEALPVPPEACAAVIRKYLDAHRQTQALFIASDEAAFLEFVAKKFKGVEIISHDDSMRSGDGEAIHKSAGGDKYEKGKDALVNCLLLSRCDALIKTASFLSAWSCVFNPTLPVVLLNAPYKECLWFPDREVEKKSMKEYLTGP